MPVSIDYCNHTSFALQTGNPSAGAIFKRKCKYKDEILSPAHLLQHVEIYTLADYFRIDDLKEYALEKVKAVLHVYWLHNKLQLAEALEEAFTSTPEHDMGVRRCLTGILKEHPGLWIDEGDVNDWLNNSPLVLDEVMKSLTVFGGMKKVKK